MKWIEGCKGSWYRSDIFERFFIEKRPVVNEKDEKYVVTGKIARANSKDSEAYLKVCDTENEAKACMDSIVWKLME